jgi:hypothetical protein
MTENLTYTHREAKFIPAKWWREKISLSERFGLWVSFTRSADEYLTITAIVASLRRDADATCRRVQRRWYAGARLAHLPASPVTTLAADSTPEWLWRRADGRRDARAKSVRGPEIVDAAVVCSSGLDCRSCSRPAHQSL